MILFRYAMNDAMNVNRFQVGFPVIPVLLWHTSKILAKKFHLASHLESEVVIASSNVCFCCILGDWDYLHLDVIGVHNQIYGANSEFYYLCALI